LLKEQEERLEQERRLQEQREREAKEEKQPTISIEVPVSVKLVASALRGPDASPTTPTSIDIEASPTSPSGVARSDSAKPASTPPQTPAAPAGKPSLSATLPTSSRLAALKSDTSGAEASYDDTEKEGTDTGDGKGKKKKRHFKMPSFSRKKKDGEKRK
jgi:hypothetical protein